MCLLVFAWNVHPRWRLIFAGNRDEFHERPTAPMQWWADAPHLLAGRDLRAGGTWLGLARDGRFGVVTNYRDLQKPLPGTPSRGGLITEYLKGNATTPDFTAALERQSGQYAGFNLLLAGAQSMVYASNRAPQFACVLEPGIYGLSNHLLDTPWHKLERTRARFTRLIEHSEPSSAGLFEMLADRTPAPEHRLPSTGLSPEWEQLLSSPFIVDERYGTRCS